jgi:hypothetical protein
LEYGRIKLYSDKRNKTNGILKIFKPIGLKRLRQDAHRFVVYKCAVG